jgi:hypothetical protein
MWVVIANNVETIMAKYEHIILKGIPFIIDESRAVYTYDTLGTGGAGPIAIGTVGTDRSSLTLLPDWESRTAERVATWRASLAPTERGKIRAQFKPPKQSRARKNTGKSSSTTGS